MQSYIMCTNNCYLEKGSHCTGINNLKVINRLIMKLMAKTQHIWNIEIRKYVLDCLDKFIHMKLEISIILMYKFRFYTI